MPKRDPENEPERQPSDLFSSAETRAMLEEFRALVRAGVLKVTPDNEVLFVKEPPGEQVTEPPPEAPLASDEEIRLLDKLIGDWRNRERRSAEPRQEARPQLRSANLRQQVVNRLAEKLIEGWDSSESSLRHEVIDRVVQLLLQRWDREQK